MNRLPKMWRPAEAPVEEKGSFASPSDEEVGNKETHVTTTHPIDHDTDSIDTDLQAGVQKVEAVTKVWSTKHLIAAYIMIWIIAFVDTMQQGMSSGLLPYVTSEFQLHSLTATTGIMSSLIGGLIQLPLAKVLDIWGRPQGYATMVAISVLGLIMMAASNGVQMYAAAQVFYWVGFNGTSYCISIFVADTSQLKNRSIMFAFQASPYIATTWIGGPLATLFLNGPGFRWGYGAFAIIVPVVSFPLWALFAYNYNKAKKAGLVPVRQSNRTLFESVKHYVIEFDVLGILLFATGLALFLLSFNLYTYQADQWKSPMIICFIVFGGLLVIAFALYEKYLAPKCFIPFELLTDRTVLSACWLGGFFFISFYVWDAYFLSFLQVVNGLTITEASYVGNIYTIGSCFWSFVVAILIRITGRFKWLAVYFGVPVTMLGVGLMIAFRQPDVNIGYIIMCQIFIAFAGGTIVITEQMAVMAATSHQYIAVVLALLGMFSYIGGAIGNTVAAAVWTGVFPVRLAEYLPAEEQANLMSIYGDITVQMSYPKGTAARAAIERAYGDAQRDMLIGGTAILAAAMVCVLLWRDIKVKDFRQVKGNVI